MRRFWNSLSRGKQITLAVLFGHFLLLLALTIHHFATPKPLHRPIAIHTVRSESSSVPPKQHENLILKPASDSQISHHPKSSPRTKSPQRPTSSSRPTPKSPSSKKPPQQKASSILDQLSQSLETLSSHSASPPKAELPIPKLLTKKPAVTIEHPLDLTYAQSLIFFLQNALELPEIGEVKVSLTILPSGTLQSCEIIASKNSANSAFLKNRLPQLPFPCFNDVDSKTLTLVFRNVEVR